MPVSKIARPHNLVDTAAESAEHAIDATREATNQALDTLADSVLGLRDKGSPALNHAKEQANAFAQRGLASMRDARQLLRDKAAYASDTTAGYVRDDPMKALLIAAATGALLMALVNLFSHTRQR